MSHTHTHTHTHTHAHIHTHAHKHTEGQTNEQTIYIIRFIDKVYPHRTKYFEINEKCWTYHINKTYEQFKRDKKNKMKTFIEKEKLILMMFFLCKR